MRRALFMIVLLSGCATAPDQAPPDAPAPEAPAPETVQRQESVAVAGLMQSARTETAAGRLSSAAAALERALRIEPRNPRLWHELARVRLRQGEYAQAESMAARSNTWAANDAALRAANQQVIDAAREAAGRR